MLFQGEAGLEGLLTNFTLHMLVGVMSFHVEPEKKYLTPCHMKVKGFGMINDLHLFLFQSVVQWGYKTVIKAVSLLVFIQSSFLSS